MKENPLVSVIIPCFNHERFIRESILSVLNQEYRSIELIVIDDGSSDQSVDLIEKLKKERDFTFISQKNRGISNVLNKGISIAKGEYISFLASDDYWLPNKVSIQIAFFKDHPEFKMIFSNAYIVDDESNIIGEFQNSFPIQKAVSFKEIALGKKTIPALTVMVDREVFLNIGGFDENLIIEDWDMWLRISNSYLIAGISDVLACYRKHGSNISLVRLEDMTRTRFHILNKWESKIDKRLFNKISRNLEILAMDELENSGVLKEYIKPTFEKMLNSKYRRLFVKYYRTQK
ncbi:glycosyl transferase family 2 [Pseudopedobacter saltans DSM 12145]|uniref:Glycosyl transferase family 2 n=1 Tax=Pseudopedobacter saltans (strain ATCC 51119 / DSM 12145 / JCM 21818 / CCUG 39354 / LMG 10337 / NBRC 100064 / NCIMB 13643) TaxID=762903 RepID=F0S7T6_PSESL|nr:glycosyltransferase [Pseudopedobacter saltans]ADY53341.1 glycosyl transferase family 2 [Pseudopedobacter saltans DSM 12145]